jgi:glutamate-1-semialdehyde 2,1-aminomutase
LKAANIPFVINHLGSMLSVHFSNKPVTDFASASAANNAFFSRFFHAMLDQGVYLPPSAFETWFLSNALTTEDLDKTIEAAKTTVASGATM